MKRSYLIPLSAKGAMNVENADIRIHVQHLIDNGAVFWDVNEAVPEREWRYMEGGWLFFNETPGPMVRYRASIKKMFPGGEKFMAIATSQVYSKYLTQNRKYHERPGEREEVLEGRKCRTFILLDHFDVFQPVTVRDFKKKDGRPIDMDFVEGRGIFVTPPNLDNLRRLY